MQTGPKKAHQTEWLERDQKGMQMTRFYIGQGHRGLKLARLLGLPADRQTMIWLDHQIERSTLENSVSNHD